MSRNCWLSRDKGIKQRYTNLLDKDVFFSFVKEFLGNIHMAVFSGSQFRW